MSKLFKVTIEQYKVFYVEADSQAGALESEYVTDEFHHDAIDWEHNSTQAEEICADQAKFIRRRCANEILPKP